MTDHARGMKMSTPIKKPLEPTVEESTASLDVSGLSLTGDSGANTRNLDGVGLAGALEAGSMDCSQEREVQGEDDQEGVGLNGNLDKDKVLSKRQKRRLKTKANKEALLNTSLQSGTPTGPVGRKRARNSDSTPTPPEARQTKKRAHGRPPGRTFAQVTAGVKVAIVPRTYPQGRLSQDQETQVNDAIARRIVDQEERAYVPQFLDSKLSRGALVVTCEGLVDREWLENVLKNPQWTGGMALKAIPTDELVVHRRCIIYATSGLDGQGMIKALGRQNATLDVGVWHLVHHVKDAGHGQSSVMVELPMQEWEALERLRGPMLGLRRAKCVLLEERGKKKASKEP